MGVETALIVGGAAMSAAGSVSSGKNAKAWGKYQQKQAQADAAAQIGAGKVEANNIRDQGAKQHSQAVAATAANGVVVGQDTAADIEKQIDSRTEYDAQITQYNAQDAANRILAEGEAANLRGQQEYQASKVQAVGSLLGGAASVAGKWSTSGKAKTPTVEDRSTKATPSSGYLINSNKKPFGFY